MREPPFKRIFEGFYPIKYSVIDDDLEHPLISETIALRREGFSESQIYYRFGIGKRQIRNYVQVFESLNKPLLPMLSKFPEDAWIRDLIEIKTNNKDKFPYNFEIGEVIEVSPDFIILSVKDGRSREYVEVHTDDIISIKSEEYPGLRRLAKYIKLGYVNMPSFFNKPEYREFKYFFLDNFLYRV